MVAKIFTEAEWVNDRLGAPSTQGRSDLPAEHSRRRTTDKHLHLFRIQYPSDESFPARYALDFVEAEYDLAAISELRTGQIILLQHPA
jgi:hypothetical protein